MSNKTGMGGNIMALILCPECEHKISDSAMFCPNCGYVLKKESDTLNSSKNKHNVLKKDAKAKISKIYNFVCYIVRLEWAEDVADFLRGVPFIGWLLSAIFLLVVFVGSCGIAIFGVGFLLYLIGQISPFLTAAICFVAGIFVAYYASYGSGQRKKWYFWLSLSLFGPCAFFCLIQGIIDLFA